jgi:hypothetical protein
MAGLMSLGTGMAVAGGLSAVGSVAGGIFGASRTPPQPDYNKLNAIAQENAKKIAGLVKNYEGKVAVNSDNLKSGQQALAATYQGQGLGSIGNYQIGTQNALGGYGVGIQNIASSVFPTELEAAKVALGYNTENLDNYGAVGSYLSNSDQAQRLGMLNYAMPGYTQGMDRATENSLQQMQGMVPADVQASLARSSAFGALQSGIRGGSGLGRNLAARDLGLTSLQLSQQGTQNFQSLANNQFNMGVAGLQSTGANVMQNYGVNSGQAMNAAGVGLSYAAQGLATGLQGQLATQGMGLSSNMGMYGNIYNTGYNAELAAMQANNNALGVGLGTNANAINSRFQSQMNIENQQAMAQAANYNAQTQYITSGMQGMFSGIGQGIGGYTTGNYLSHLGTHK